jgi:hypothetical protein
MISDPRGLGMCSRYAIAPNSLHYCGPERQTDLLGYVQHRVADGGLLEILNRFDTLYKYLVLIASHNHITDPFQKRVVEAYWIGNRLLHTIPRRRLVSHVVSTLGVGKRVTSKKMSSIVTPILVDGFPHHNFHVLALFMRTGHNGVPHTLATMDHCRISWGNVVSIQTSGAFGTYTVKTRPLEYIGEKLQLGAPVFTVVKSVGVVPKVGDWVSLHWGYVCEVLDDTQRRQLAFYTGRVLLTVNRGL